jgi:hypothetical protein
LMRHFPCPVSTHFNAEVLYTRGTHTKKIKIHSEIDQAPLR